MSDDGTFGATLRDVSVSLPSGGEGLDARVGVRGMSRRTVAFCLVSGERGQPKSSLGKNKPCDQMTGTKALGLGLGFCPKPWIFQLLSGSVDIYWAQVAIGKHRSIGGCRLVG